MAIISVIGESGQLEEVEVTTEGVVIEYDDGTRFAPAVAQRVEYDDTGQMSKIVNKTKCREVSTEVRREGDDKPDIAIEGILTEEQLQDAKGLKSQRELTLVSDLYRGQVTVKRVTIEQNNDIIHFTPDGGETQLAFPFQIQLKEQ